MLAYTPNYHIGYLTDATPLIELAAATKQNADALDAAMGRAGYTPPDATSFAALAARVAVVETAAPRVTATGAAVSCATGAIVPLSFTARSTRSLTSMWAAGAPTRLVAPVAGEYDLAVSWSWSGGLTAGLRAFAYRVNGGGANFYHVYPQAGAGEQSATRRGIDLTAGQYVEVLAQQTSGQTINCTGYTATLALALK